MKFMVERDPLLDALSWVSKSISSRPIQTALLGVLIDAEDELTFTSSDFETTSTAKTPAEIIHKGKVLVPGRLFVEIVKALPNKTVSIYQDGTKVFVSAGSAKFTLPTLALQEFPNLPAMPEVVGSFTGEEFTNSVAQVAVAAGRDDSLLTLTGVSININVNEIVFAATDRYRLAVKNSDWLPKSNDIETSTLVRARTLTEVARAVSQKDNLEIGLSALTNHEKLIGFSSGGKTLISRVLDGTFPPFSHLLPKESSAFALINRSELLDSVRRVSLVTDKTVPLRLIFNDNSLNLEAGGTDEAQASEALEIIYEGEELNIAFNPQFLIDGLNAIEGERVYISFTGSNKPAVLSGEENGTPMQEFRYLLMPMKYAY
jgi:DNA polymerase-3 subunit beta